MSEEEAAPAHAKVDPETLAIRTQLPRAIRFKRELIIAIAAIGSVVLVGVTAMAMMTPRLNRIARGGRERSARLSGSSLAGCVVVASVTTASGG